MENKKEILPIGSVVLLDGGTKKVMITGFCSISAEDRTKVYDYSGCMYPEGFLDSNQVCLFNHEQIKEIFFLGYENDEEKEFKKVIEEVITKYQDGTIPISTENNDFEDDEDSDNDENINTVEDLEYL